MTSIRVGFLSFQNYLDRNTWSGTLYSMYQALNRKRLDIIPLGNPQKPSFFKKVMQRLLNRKHQAELNPIEELQYYQDLAHTLQDQLSNYPCNLLFAPVAARELSLIKTDLPIVYLSDATSKVLQETYPTNSYLEKAEANQRNEIIALSKSSRYIYSSQWAANSAIHDYSVDPQKVYVIPFGANINSLPSLKKISFFKGKMSPLRLLFIGLNWQRKGGDIAIQTLLSLLKTGIDAQLTIMGSIPLEFKGHPQIKVIPFLNKNSFYQRQIFNQILLKSHFLILPSRADCSPIVMGEANAFGMPVMTTDVGGISTIIREGKNGYMFPLSAGGDEYANLILKLVNSASEYEQLIYSSRQEYEQRLNWNTWAESTVKVFEELRQQD